jgi:arylsulfatase A-like enzyme
MAAQSFLRRFRRALRSGGCGLLVLVFAFAAPNTYGTDSYSFRVSVPRGIITRPLHDEKLPIVHDVSAGEILYVAYAIPEEFYGDRAVYTLTVTAETAKDSSTIMKKKLSPWKEAADRGWHAEKIPLDKFAGKKVTVRFKSLRKGADGSRFESALWGAVRIGNHTRREDEFNIILLSIDTLRADRLGASGYRRNTSPEIDHLAFNGVYFPRAVTQTSWTKPSHMSLFTSLYPSIHGLEAHYGQRGVDRRLSQRFMTLTEYLRDHGYLTQAFTGAGHVTATVGFDRGFDCFHEFPVPDHADGKYVYDYGKDWIKANVDKKFFLFLHTYEVHRPRKHTFFVKPGMTGMKKQNALYDSGVRYASRLIGDLTSTLDQLGIRKNTLIVIFSDHGEMMGEHGIYDHGVSLYDPVVLVPLIFNRPGTIAPRRVENFNAQLVDVFPTICDLLGSPPPPGLVGRSLKPIFMGEPVPAESIGMSELTWNAPGGTTLNKRPSGRNKATTEVVIDPKQSPRRLVSLRLENGGSHKMIYHAGFAEGTDSGGYLKARDNAWRNSQLAGGKQLFDLTEDPKEKINIQPKFPSLFDQLLKRFKDELANGPAPADDSEDEHKPVLPDVAEQLRSLGY